MERAKSKSEILPVAGPWPTKSGGELSVLFNFDREEVLSFTDIKSELSGLRVYRVTGLKEGTTGANEWHEIRTEMAFVTRGAVTWHITHSDGSETSVESNASSQGIMIPPGSMHTYHVTMDDTELLVIANTTFDPNDASTHDTYGQGSFTSDD